MDKKEFIDSIKEGALRGQAEFNILPSLTIAQAILESGWGSSQLSQRANNLFGIKAFSDWKGNRITLPTAECYNDTMQIINSDFRAYDSFKDSIEDHNKLLSFARYEAVRQCREYRSACIQIYECGYATDPEYTEKLIRIIEENKLYELDPSNVLLESAICIESEKTRNFQRLCNRLNIRDDEGQALDEDNILGPKTQSCIPKLPIIMTGSTGPEVEFIQRVIGAEPVDGIFGDGTRECVIKYQRQYCLDVDGIVGPQTWTVLITR